MKKLFLLLLIGIPFYSGCEKKVEDNGTKQVVKPQPVQPITSHKLTNKKFAKEIKIIHADDVSLPIEGANEDPVQVSLNASQEYVYFYCYSKDNTQHHYAIVKEVNGVYIVLKNLDINNQLSSVKLAANNLEIDNLYVVEIINGIYEFLDDVHSTITHSGSTSAGFVAHSEYFNGTRANINDGVVVIVMDQQFRENMN